MACVRCLKIYSWPCMMKHLFTYISVFFGWVENCNRCCAQIVGFLWFAGLSRTSISWSFPFAFFALTLEKLFSNPWGPLNETFFLIVLLRIEKIQEKKGTTILSSFWQFGWVLFATLLKKLNETYNTRHPVCGKHI